MTGQRLTDPNYRVLASFEIHWTFWHLPRLARTTARNGALRSIRW